MKNTKNILAAAAVLMISSCSSYKGVYDATKYMDTSDANTHLKFKSNMSPNISNKHKILYVAPHVNLENYIDPDVAKSKKMLPKYRAYVEADTSETYNRVKDRLTKLKYRVLESDEEKKYFIIQGKNDKYKMQVLEFEKGSIVYVINEQDRIMLQAKFKQLFKNL